MKTTTNPEGKMLTKDQAANVVKISAQNVVVGDRIFVGDSWRTVNHRRDYARGVLFNNRWYAEHNAMMDVMRRAE